MTLFAILIFLFGICNAFDSDKRGCIHRNIAVANVTYVCIARILNSLCAMKYSYTICTGPSDTSLAISKARFPQLELTSINRARNRQIELN